MDLIARGLLNKHQKSDGHSFIYNADIGLRKWKSKLARIRAGEAAKYYINFMGDSITEGKTADSTLQGIIDNCFVGVIRSKLAAKYGDIGFAFVPSYRWSAPFTEWSYTGTWVTNTTSYGFGMYSRSTTTEGATATINFNGTGFIAIIVKDTGGSDFTITIDGGTPQAFSAYSAIVVDNATFEVSGLTDGQHTAVITKVGATNSLKLIGAYSTKGTSGIGVNMCGKSSAKVGDFNFNPSHNCIFGILPPSLTVVSFIANDFQQETDLSLYKVNLEAIVDKALEYGDVLITTIGIFNGTYQTPQIDYVNICKEVAMRKKCAFFDIYNKWSGDPSYVSNTLGYYSDSVHPNKYGHRDIAESLLQVIDSY